MKIYENKKTKALYEALCNAIDVTDNRCEEYVVYRAVDNSDKTYVRSAKEFKEKFEFVEKIEKTANTCLIPIYWRGGAE